MGKVDFIQLILPDILCIKISRWKPSRTGLSYMCVEVIQLGSWEKIQISALTTWDSTPALEMCQLSILDVKIMPITWHGFEGHLRQYEYFINRGTLCKVSYSITTYLFLDHTLSSTSRFCSVKDSRHSQSRAPREDGARDWSDESVSQGVPRTAGNHQKLEERHGTAFPQSFQKKPTLLTS